jgi:hypothetical protein
VSTEESVSSHRCAMLGNRAAESPLHTDDQTPRRTRGVIAVRVTFEVHRLAATYLATAYEQVVPLRRRSTAAPPAATPRRAAQQPAERTGA